MSLWRWKKHFSQGSGASDEHLAPDSQQHSPTYFRNTLEMVVVTSVDVHEIADIGYKEWCEYPMRHVNGSGSASITTRCVRHPPASSSARHRA